VGFCCRSHIEEAYWGGYYERVPLFMLVANFAASAARADNSKSILDETT
jgi:hypothetical protein